MLQVATVVFRHKLREAQKRLASAMVLQRQQYRQIVVFFTAPANTSDVYFRFARCSRDTYMK